MTVEQAIAARVSRRSYYAEPLPPTKKALLCARIEQINQLMDARIVFVEDGTQIFSRLGKGYGRFSGVHSFFALIERADSALHGEALGYFGELLVLESVNQGLGTCWVGGTFDRDICPCALEENEMIRCIITLGNCSARRGFKEYMIYRFSNQAPRKLQTFYQSDRPVPAWFQEGIQAVRRAPSAYARQPVRFLYREGVVSAFVPNLEQYRGLDLGIAKAHFALPTGGRWEWGNHAPFQKCKRGHYGMELPKAVDALLNEQCAKKTLI